jgi:heterodisulfide reductase subunit C
MFFSISLYVCLTIFGLGMVHKTWKWFCVSVAPEARNIPVSARVTAAFKGIPATVFSKKLLVLLRVFLRDVLFQAWLFKKDFFRWLAHILIYGGFVLLLLMHGLERIITASLFSEYYSTLNPFMFLRDFFGALVFVGIAMVLYRRLLSRGPRPKTTAPDAYAIIILVVIMTSGVFLEGTKITSYSIYQEMVYEFAGLDETEDKEEFMALEAHWVDAFGVVSTGLKGPVHGNILQQGKELHNDSCANCHSSPYWAFMGYGIAKATKPVASLLDKANVHTWLWYFHFLACFVGLAWLPFSKFFHLFATPVNLLMNAVMDQSTSDPANMATKQAIELDACTHCGDCTIRCSVAVAYRLLPNSTILPSEKLAALRALASGKRVSDKYLQVVQEGSHICTDCHRCTDVCPVGINLEALWLAMKDDLAQKEHPKLEVWAREIMASQHDLTKKKNQTVLLTPPDKAFYEALKGSAQASTFSVCFGCQSCTNVCPVVANFDNPQEAVGLMPHQIMHALALGRRDLALGSRMLWDCVTCYLCQEHCPQGVCVTDVLYQMKNVAFKELKGAS